jgi:hypothetical protein
MGNRPVKNTGESPENAPGADYKTNRFGQSRFTHVEGLAVIKTQEVRMVVD